MRGTLYIAAGLAAVLVFSSAAWAESASVLLEKGIYNEQTKGDLDAAIEVFVAEHFVPRSALSLRLATRGVRDSKRAELERRLDESERLYLEELLPTHDGVEGIEAFIEKRPPVWTNA